MNKFLTALLLGVILTAGTSGSVYATGNTTENINTKVGRYTKFVYDRLSFKKMNKMSYQCFSKAFYGYLNMREAGKLRPNSLLVVCDFSLSSTQKRMWIIDVAKKKVIMNTWVAHGSGSGEEFATKFSNAHDSHQSSLGFYTTGETYMGEKGYSLKLHGQDGAFNSNAFDRGVVIHGADYVNDAFIKANNRCGRSHGCPALSYEIVNKVIDMIKDGHCLFIYHPMKSYTTQSYWLTNRIARLPQEADLADVLMPQASSGWPRDIAQGTDTLKSKGAIKNNAIIIQKKSLEDSNGIPQTTTTSPVQPSINTPAASTNSQQLQNSAVPSKAQQQDSVPAAAPANTNDSDANNRDFLLIK